MSAQQIKSFQPLTLLTNCDGRPQSLPHGATVLANALALEISICDSVVRTTGGNGACDNIQPRRTVTALAVSSLSGTSAAKVSPGGQLYVKQEQRLPILLSDFLKATRGNPRYVFALPDYPNYYVENTMNVYTDYYSYRRNMLIGAGYDLLLRKHWYIGFSVQYGF